MPHRRGVTIRMNANTNTVHVSDGTTSVAVDRSNMTRKEKRGLTDLVRESWETGRKPSPRRPVNVS